jgi:hypothetical protein
LPKRVNHFVAAVAPRTSLVKFWFLVKLHRTLLRGPANSLIQAFIKIEDFHDRAELRHRLSSIVGLTLGIKKADDNPSFDDINQDLAFSRTFAPADGIRWLTTPAPPHGA